MTGKQLPGSPDEIRDSSEALPWIHSTFIARAKKEWKVKRSRRATFQMSNEELRKIGFYTKKALATIMLQPSGLQPHLHL